MASFTDEETADMKAAVERVHVLVMDEVVTLSTKHENFDTGSGFICGLAVSTLGKILSLEPLINREHILEEITKTVMEDAREEGGALGIKQQIMMRNDQLRREQNAP